MTWKETWKAYFGYFLRCYFMPITASWTLITKGPKAAKAVVYKRFQEEDPLVKKLTNN
jgi:hypothetical protein